MLIAEGFAGFEGVGGALAGFAFAAEADKRFAFEVEDVLLADELRGQSGPPVAATEQAKQELPSSSDEQGEAAEMAGQVRTNELAA